jgi:hypothetical protein
VIDDRRGQSPTGRTPKATESVLIAARDGELDLTRAHAAMAELSQRMRALPEVVKIAEPVTAREANWWVPRFLAGPRRSAGTTHRDDDAETQVIIPLSGR